MPILRPQSINEPFCATGDKLLPTPISSVTVASQPIGFPPSQSIPQSTGGEAVKRNEMNGVFNLYSQTALAFQAGLMPIFDTSNSVTSIGLTLGYNNGAVLWDEISNQWLVSTKDANLDNYVTTRSFIGTSWIPVQRYNFDNISNNSTGKRVTIQHTTTDGLTPVLTNAGLDITGDATVTNVLNIPTAIPNLGYLTPLIRAISPIGQIMYIDTGDGHQLTPSLVGWHNCGGETIINCRTLYPDYWAYIGIINPANTDHTTTIGRPYKSNGNDAVVPNLAGVFLRAFGTFDVDHVSASQSIRQYDQNLSHTHNFNQFTFPVVDSPGLGTGGYRAIGADPLGILPAGGAEARPLNVSYEVFTRIAYTI
jgi:hypothetical protein